jgi:hypothetical protein
MTKEMKDSEYTYQHVKVFSDWSFRLERIPVMSARILATSSSNIINTTPLDIPVAIKVEVTWGGPQSEVIGRAWRFLNDDVSRLSWNN